MQGDIEKGIGKKSPQAFSGLAETFGISEKKFADGEIFSTFATRYGGKGEWDER